MTDFKEYQEFVNSLKVYPEPHAITYPTLGLAGEAAAGFECERFEDIFK
jgi:hypothetical protein